MAAELDGTRPGDDAPMTMSPLSRTMSGQSGLQIDADSGKEFYRERGQPVHGPGERSRRSTARQGSVSSQPFDRRASDLETMMNQPGTPPSINQATRPILRRSSTSEPNAPQYNDRRDSNMEYGQIENLQPSDVSNGNATSSTSQVRRTSLPFSINHHDGNIQESQRRGSNTQTLNTSGGSGSNPMEPVVELPNAVASADRLIQPPPSRPKPKRKRRLLILFLVIITLLAGLISGFVLYSRYKDKNAKEATLPKQIIGPQPSNMPITDSNIGAAEVVIGTYFSTAASGVLQTKLVYNDGKGNLCIRTKSGTDWLNVQCLEDANPRADTPLTVLDWLGGPSIYFITADNFLSGVDHMPLNDTWRFSSVRDQMRPTHKQSQLASVTWFNGTSSWLYYQDTNSQLREFGLDDYRDIAWRDGSIGPLGLALAGSGIGASRWWLLSDGSEVLEVFIQVSGGALHGRVYMESVWTSDFYAVDGTPNTVSEGAALTSTVIHQPNSTVVLLAYVSSDGYLTVQSRGTANGTNTQFDAFSAPEKIVQGDGGATTGIAAYDSSGQPVIYFVKGDAILEISAPDVAATNWTTFDVTSS